MSVPALLTEAEAAEALSLCTRTLRKERNAGRLSWVQVGRKILYSPDDLRAYIDAQRRQASERKPTPRPNPQPKQGGVVIPFSERMTR